MPRRDVEVWLSRALTAGVLLAATVAVIGGGLHLAHHAHERVSLIEFRPSAGMSVRALAAGASQWDSGGIMVCGLLLLILTPVVRVALSLFLFAVKRDWLYVGITLLVLAALVVGLLGIVG